MVMSVAYASIAVVVFTAVKNAAWGFFFVSFSVGTALLGVYRRLQEIKKGQRVRFHYEGGRRRRTMSGTYLHMAISCVVLAAVQFAIMPDWEHKAYGGIALCYAAFLAFVSVLAKADEDQEADLYDNVLFRTTIGGFRYRAAEADVLFNALTQEN